MVIERLSAALNGNDLIKKIYDGTLVDKEGKEYIYYNVQQHYKDFLHEYSHDDMHGPNPNITFMNFDTYEKIIIYGYNKIKDLLLSMKVPIDNRLHGRDSKKEKEQVYINTHQIYIGKDKIKRVLYKKGESMYIKRRSPKTGKMVFSKIKNKIKY